MSAKPPITYHALVWHDGARGVVATSLVDSNNQLASGLSRDVLREWVIGGLGRRVERWEPIAPPPGRRLITYDRQYFVVPD